MTVDVPRGPGVVAGVTPMAERVAVLGLLNKRNGIVRDLKLRPGQAVRVRDAIVRLRACEASAPWENERLTGAFVQLDVEQRDRQLAAGLFGLAVQGKSVAQRRRACGLRRVAQELRNALARGRRRAGEPVGFEQPVERAEIGRGGSRRGRHRRHRPPKRRRASRSRRPPEPLVIEPSAADNNPT